MKRFQVVGFSFLALALAGGALLGLRHFRRAETTPALRGEAIARAQGCFACHGPEGRGGVTDPGARSGVVPGWTGPEVATYARNETEIVEWILDGKLARLHDAAPHASHQPLLPMPAYRGKISSAELADLLVYFRAVSAFDTNITALAYEGLHEAQKLGCLACHGPGGTGGATNPGSFKGHIPAWDGSEYGELVRDDAELREWILDGAPKRLRNNPAARHFLDGQLVQMPAYRRIIADDQLAKISGYIAWRRTPRQPAELHDPVAPSFPAETGRPASPLYRSPVFIGLSPDGATACVVNYTANLVSLLDIRSRKILAEIPVDARPSQARFSPDGRTLYVSCTWAGKIDVVDLTQNKVTRSLTAGLEPCGLALSADGRTLAVTNVVSSTVSLVDIASGRTLAETPVGSQPRFAALTPDASRLLVSNGLSPFVTVLDAADGRELGRYDLGRASMLREIVTTRDGHWAFLTNLVSHNEVPTVQMERGWINSNGFSVLDLTQPGRRVTLLLDQLLSGATNPSGIAVSSDARRLYVSLAGIHEVAIVDLPAALALAEKTKTPREIQLLEEDVEILAREKIARRLPAGGLGPRSLALSEATGELLVANFFSDNVTILDAATGELRATIPLGSESECRGGVSRPRRSENVHLAPRRTHGQRRPHHLSKLDQLHELPPGRHLERRPELGPRERRPRQSEEQQIPPGRPRHAARDVGRRARRSPGRRRRRRALPRLRADGSRQRPDHRIPHAPRPRPEPLSQRRPARPRARQKTFHRRRLRCLPSGADVFRLQIPRSRLRHAERFPQPLRHAVDSELLPHRAVSARWTRRHARGALPRAQRERRARPHARLHPAGARRPPRLRENPLMNFLPHVGACLQAISPRERLSSPASRLLPAIAPLALAALALPLLSFAAEPAEPPAAPLYSSGAMHAPYAGTFSPELARTVADADRGNPPSRFGKQMSRQWSYGATWTRENLRPVANPHPAPEPQPRRDHPFDVAIDGAGTKVYVSLLGSEAKPGTEIAVYDVATDQLLRRIPLKIAGTPAAIEPGTSPMRLTFHPDGRHLFVGNRYSNFLSVIDTKTDTVVLEVPLDFYAQGIAFSADGKIAYVANRYLDEVLVLDIETEATGVTGDRFAAKLRVIGGLDDHAYYASNGIGAILQQSCGTTACHDVKRGGFVAGSDLRASFVSALDHIVPGRSAESRLLRAVIRTRDGGYADTMPLFQSHAGKTVVFGDPAHDANYRAIAKWIDSTQIGPGIDVGNPRSKPSVVVLGSSGRYLYVGNTGTQDISIVDTRLNREVGAIYIQNVVNELKIFRSPSTGDDWLFVTTMGVGFGTAKERDPWGGETWDRANPASQYTVWRNPDTAAVFAKEQQEILGPFEASDGTANFKFRDIQNDYVVIDVSKLALPEHPPQSGLNYVLKANRYESHRHWVRYTSDTAEAMLPDTKGDIPPDLMRVVGALPDKAAVVGNHLFVAMQGSGEVQELELNPDATDPSDILTPIRNYACGAQPFGIAAGVPGTISDGKLFVANFYGSSISIIDRASGKSHELPTDPALYKLPLGVTSAERGEFLVHTSAFTSDNDQSCVSCHYRELNDGRGWGVSQIQGQEYLTGQTKVGNLVEGTTMLPPQQKSLWAIQPFFLEGSLSVYDPRSMLMEHCPADDFKERTGQGDFRHIEAHAPVLAVQDIQSKTTSSADNEAYLEERRAEFFRRQSLKYFGKSFVLRDFQRFVGEWQAHEPRLFPNPFDQAAAAVNRGRALFNHPQLGCASCHPAPAFAKKDFPNNPRQVLPPQVPLSVRDTGFTLISMHRLDYLAGIRRDLEPWDIGRAETPDQNQHITPLQLRGAWDRPPLFLHNAMARSLREVVAAPGVPGLAWFKYEPLMGGSPERPGRREVGFNETYMILKGTNAAKVHLQTGGRIASDAHGGTSQLTPAQIDDLVAYLESIE